MKHFLLALATVLLMSCTKELIKPEPEIIPSLADYEKLIAEKDTLGAEKIKNAIITKLPRSKETFDFACIEFYDRLYPVWTNDSMKIIILKDLFKKHPETNWRRTMYLYYINSLGNLKQYDELKTVLGNFVNDFPEDYLPHYTSARNYYIHLNDTTFALDNALRAFDYSKNYPKSDYFPPMEWDLEKRSAKVSAGSCLAEILIDKKNYKKAFDVLYDTIDNNSLGIDDEVTLCRPYYLLGKAYGRTGDKEKSLTYLAKGLIAGDSRNVWQLCDSVYQVSAGLKNRKDNLDHIRITTGFQEIIYNDVTELYGLKDITAGRIAWGDFNNDGFQDILLDGKRLFKNSGGKSFLEVTVQAFPDTINANGGLWSDLDNDGDLDIITKDPEAVWLNSKGIFKKMTGESCIADNGVSTEGIGIADLNNDGNLDVYFANYEKNYVYEEDQLFFGTGKGKFRNVTKETGILPADSINRAGRGVNIGDFDNDGDPDIYVSNYRLTENFLFRNDSSGTFTNCAREKGAAGLETDTWWGHTIGSEWGDIDNDGDLDLVTANLAHPRYIDFSNMTMLYENSGSPDYKFTDIRKSAGIKYEETHSEPALGDLDNDGYLDLYINDVYEGRRSFLYMNNGNKTFRDVSYLSGTRHFNGWGVAYADIDNDGDLDIISAGGKIQLFRNETKKLGNCLLVKVTGKDHSDAIGTRLRLFNKNISLIREIQGGKGTTNQHSLVQHFGVGKETGGFTLEITFPNGKKRFVKIKKLNTLINIKE